MRYPNLIQVIAAAAITLTMAGCTIEKTELAPPVRVGSVYVTLRDTSGSQIDSGQISVDNFVTTLFTPDTVAGISAGAHVVGAYKLGYEPVADSVVVMPDSIISATLITQPTTSPPPVIELVNAPDSTVLLLSNRPSGMTPPTMFDSIGVGAYQLSMYLAGHATDLPAQWTVNLQLGDTARIPASFTLLANGNQPGGLAPTFDLVDDGYPDSSHYRLEDYRGRVILLTFFFVDCAPCLAEMPAIQAVYSDPAYAGKIEFFGIDPNDPYFHFRLFRIAYHPELGLQFPLLYALNQGVKEAYDVVPFPTNFVIDQTGTIRYRWGGLTETMLREAINTLLAESP